MTVASSREQIAREGYARMWLGAYHGNHPLFIEIREAARAHPNLFLPPVVVTAVVRFSADEVWNPDPPLERAVAKQLERLKRGPSSTPAAAGVARSVQQRAAIRRQALNGMTRTTRRR